MARLGFSFMTRFLLLFFTALMSGLPGGPSAQACSAFLYPSTDRVIVGRNFDWPMNHGFITINQRNLEKTGLWIPGEARSVWTSKFGSITFNELSRDLPQGGVNEAGLLVEVLALDHTVYPEHDSRAAISELEWIQYQLDRFSSVDEVVAHLEDIRIHKLVVGVHYFICDRTRKCAAVEPLGGKLSVHYLDALPVLTNDTYAESRAYAEKFLKAGQCKKVPGDYGSMNRFTRAACSLEKISNLQHKVSPIETVYSVLDEIKDPENTRWSFAYDLTRGVVYIRTKVSPKIKSVRLAGFNYSCKTPSLRLDINNPAEGDITSRIDHHGAYEDPKTGDWNPLVGMAHLGDMAIEGILGISRHATCKE